MCSNIIKIVYLVLMGALLTIIGCSEVEQPITPQPKSSIGKTQFHIESKLTTGWSIIKFQEGNAKFWLARKQQHEL